MAAGLKMFMTGAMVATPAKTGGGPSGLSWRSRSGLIDLIVLAGVMGLVVATFYGKPVAATPWSEVAAPTAGPQQVIGGPANGCIAGAEALAAVGPGFVSVRRYRNRYYGHASLIRFIGDLGRQQEARDGRFVMIGDLSQPRGGRMASRHRSHQNGLDVDVWLHLADSPAAARALMDERDDPTSMVAPDGEQLSPAWGPAQRQLIEAAARHPLVDRLLVNPAIKRALCREVRGDRGWLRKVRPWSGHDAHMHVRLVCPPDSRDCRGQGAIPAGDGCGAELAWWFSAEARRPSKKSGGSAPPPPPAACERLLQGS